MAIAALVFGLGAAGILRLRGSDKPGPVLARGQEPTQSVLTERGPDDNPSILPKQADQPAATLTKPGPVRMPDDVRAWLEHLEKIERAKQALSQDEQDDLMISMRSIDQMVTKAATDGLLDPDSSADPEAGVNDFLPIKKMTADWKELRRQFNQDGPPVPDECKDLHDQYDSALMQVPGVLKDINDIAGNLFDEDKKPKIKGLREVQRTHQDYIDKPLHRSDRLLGDICDHYQTRKWFDIKVDNAGGLMGIPGF
jgi:hypothetical protein